MQCGAGGDGGGGVAGEAEAIERASAELAFEQGNGVVGAEGPVVEARLGADGIEGCGRWFRRGRAGKSERLRGEEQFGRLLARQLIERRAQRRICRRTRWRGIRRWRDRAARGRRDRSSIAALRGRGVERGEIVVALRALRGIERGAGREDARDFAADDLLRELGVFHLLADGDAVALCSSRPM